MTRKQLEVSKFKNDSQRPKFSIQQAEKKRELSFKQTNHTTIASPALYDRSTSSWIPSPTDFNIALQVLLYANKGGPKGTNANRLARGTFYRKVSQKGKESNLLKKTSHLLNK